MALQGSEGQVGASVSGRGATTWGCGSTREEINTQKYVKTFLRTYF